MGWTSILTLFSLLLYVVSQRIMLQPVQPMGAQPFVLENTVIRCPPGFYRPSRYNVCHMFIADLRDYLDCKLRCKAQSTTMPSYLAHSVKTHQQIQGIQALAQKIGLPKPESNVLLQRGEGDFFIEFDMFRASKDKYDFEFGDGVKLKDTPLGQNNWHKGEPNNVYGKEKCAAFSIKEGKFNDRVCDGYGSWALCESMGVPVLPGAKGYRELAIQQGIPVAQVVRRRGGGGGGRKKNDDYSGDGDDDDEDDDDSEDF